MKGSGDTKWNPPFRGSKNKYSINDVSNGDSKKKAASERFVIYNVFNGGTLLGGIFTNMCVILPRKTTTERLMDDFTLAK